MPADALGILMMLVVAALVINWAMITITHLKFRQHLRAQGKTAAFVSPLAPLSNWICLVFLASILLVMGLTPGIRTALLLIPAWIALLALAYRVFAD